MPTRRAFLQRAALLAALVAVPGQVPRAQQGLTTRPIPSTGERLPVIGLGTSRTHDVALDDDSLQPLQEVLQAFINGGARVIDTAPSYGNAERVCGQLVKRLDIRNEVFLAS